MLKPRYLFALSFISFVIIMSVAFADEKIKIEQELPKASPVSVVVVAQCSRAVGVYGTMQDGTLLAFDMTSKVSFADVVTWAEGAKRAITVETRCVLMPGNLDAST